MTTFSEASDFSSTRAEVEVKALSVDVNKAVSKLNEGFPANLCLNTKIMKVSDSNDGLTAVTHNKGDAND